MHILFFHEYMNNTNLYTTVHYAAGSEYTTLNISIMQPRRYTLRELSKLSWRNAAKGGGNANMLPNRKQILILRLKRSIKSARR